MEILKYGNEILQQISLAVPSPDPSVQDMIFRMKECLARTPGGIGLAAPQVGILKQIFILDLSLLEEFGEEDKYTVINPRIVESRGSSKDVEGCLSFPNITTVISRPDTVKLSFRNEHWEEQTLVVKGYAARAFQHEIDHLNGILIIDRVSSIKRQLIKKEINKLKAHDQW